MRQYPSSSLLKLFIILLLFILTGCISTQHLSKKANIAIIIEQANSKFYLDERIWYQDIQAEVQHNTITLKGEAFFKAPVQAIISKLREAGYQHKIIDEINYLPETFPQDKAYGIITEPYIMSRYKPVKAKQEGTELLYGEPVRLIRDADPYIQVQSPVGYLGYIPKTALRTVSLNEWNRYHAPQQAVFHKSIELENGLTIQMGARLPYLDNDHLLLADGSEISLSSDHYRIRDASQNPLREQIIESGKQYLDLPYVWGGRSADGLDCSGFVMQSYALNDLYLPRDTDEMANVGLIIGLPGWTEAMLPGDLLFFTGSRRLVTHVAIYMGDGRVIHSLGSGVQIQSMNPDHPDYSEYLQQRFIFAKRMFD